MKLFRSSSVPVSCAFIPVARSLLTSSTSAALSLDHARERGREQDGEQFRPLVRPPAAERRCECSFLAAMSLRHDSLKLSFCGTHWTQSDSTSRVSTPIPPRSVKISMFSSFRR